jgi:transposase
MSRFLVYHAFSARTYDLIRQRTEGGVLYFHLAKKPSCRRCVACGSRNVTREGCSQYPLRSLPVGPRHTFLVLHLYRLRCHHCRALRQESRDVAQERKRYTSALARYVVGLCEQMTLSAVAQQVGLDFETVKDILKSHLRRRLRRRRLRQVRRLAIDEVAVRKGHRYLTVVVDLDSGQVLFVVPGRDHTVLGPVFAALRCARARIVAIAVDMSGSYLKGIQTFGPKDVTIVHDPFHLVAAMNQVLDEVRRLEQQRVEEQGKRVLKGARFLLLAGSESLTDQPSKQIRLQALLALNERLSQAYLLKELFRQLWSQKDKAAAELFLSRWLVAATELGVQLPPLMRFAMTVLSASRRILSWYDFRISTGPLEGINNKIKVAKRMAYGYRDLDFFRLRILFLHQTKFRLSGV